MAEDRNLNTDAPIHFMNNNSGNEIYTEEIIMEDQAHTDEKDNTESQEGRKRRNLEADNNEEWQQVNRRAKKKVKVSENPQDGLIQIRISSKQVLPKQFALARLFREHNISGILKIKYLNQHKISATFDTECNAEKFLTCKAFKELEWRCQKTWEVGISVGTIKNIECDIEIVSVKRMNRRNDETWIPCDSIKVEFKGPTLPKYIYLLDLRIKVEKYIFPVTQCSKCCRFGHTVKFCPSSRLVCPKCKSDHENCETTTFQCPNCSGNHTAFDREACRVYKKEKKIREIMAEYNCSYRKAMDMFVPPSPPTLESYSEPTKFKHVYAPAHGPLESAYYYKEKKKSLKSNNQIQIIQEQVQDRKKRKKRNVFT